jgi:hypothetical protein
MPQKAYVRASRPALIGGLIAVAAFFVIGLVFLALLVREGAGIGVIFMIFWLFVVALMAGGLIRNLRHYDKDAAGSVAEEIVLPDGVSLPGAAKSGIDFDVKLRKLEGLKNEGLISEDEYKKKRAEIMDRKW